MNLTAKTDLAGETHPVLGIVDHGSRFAVCLHALADRTAITLLRALLDAIERHGKPRLVRTDNEPVFASHLFRIALALLGIRHQRTEPHCPWQNGRVERFLRHPQSEAGSVGGGGHFSTWRGARPTKPGDGSIRTRARPSQ